MSTEHDDRAQRGATLLDQKQPGWVDRIDLDELRMASAAHCIIGQAFGSFHQGGRRLFADDWIVPAGWAHTGGVANGFYVSGDGTSEVFAEYAELDDSWQRIIEQRRNEWAQTLIEQGWYPSRDGLYMISPSTGAAVAEDGCRIEPLAPVAA